MKSGIIFPLMIIASLSSYAQRVYPVEVQVQLPHTIPSTWNLWWEPNSGFQLTILLKDIHEPSLEVFPEIELNGSTLNLRSTLEALTTIRPMESKWLSGTYFASFWNLATLNSSGTQAASLRQSGILQDGYYTFSVVIKERISKQAVSARYQQSVWIKSLDPPRLSFPICQSKLATAMVPNIQFQWQQPVGARPGDIQYQFILSDYVNENVQLDEAWASSLPLFETAITQASLLYGASMPSLSAGKKYLWKVRAISSSGLFIKNEGWSVTCSFIYGDPCHVPKDFQLLGLNGSSMMLGWQIEGQNLHGYEIRIRPKKDTNQVYTFSCEREVYTLDQLNPADEYWAEVRQQCPAENSAYTSPIGIGGLDEIKEQERCAPDTSQTPQATAPLAMLNKGDIVTIDGFQLRITEASGAQGIFSGKALGYMPFLSRTLRFHFQNIEINEAYVVSSGKVFAESEVRPLTNNQSKQEVLANFCNQPRNQDPRAVNANSTISNSTTTSNQETVSINNEFPVPIGDSIILNGKSVLMSDSLGLSIGDTIVWNGQTIVVSQIGSGSAANQLNPEYHKDIWEEAIKELKNETKDSIQLVSNSMANYVDSIRQTLPNAQLIPFIIIGENEEYLQPGMSKTFIPLYPEEFNEVQEENIRKVFRCHYLLFVEDQKWLNLRILEAKVDGLKNTSALEGLQKEWMVHLQRMSTQEVAAIGQEESTHKSAIKEFIRQ